MKAMKSTKSIEICVKVSRNKKHTYHSKKRSKNRSDNTKDRTIPPKTAQKER